MSIKSTKKVLFAWSLASIFAGAALSGQTTPAYAQDVDDDAADVSEQTESTTAPSTSFTNPQDGFIAQQARTLLGIVDSISLPTITATPQASTKKSLTEAVSNAKTRFQLKEWIHSAAILAGVVPELRANNSALYGDASYMLAESLYQAGAYELARDAFQDILNDRASSYAKTAQMRLLSIAMILRDNKAVEREYDALMRAYGNNADGAVLYLLARTKYYRNRYIDAAEQFARVPSNSAYYWRAQYYRGVSLTRDGNYAEAISVFESVENALERATNLSEKDAAVLQLARLGQGAVYYEQQEWPSAIEAYSRIDADTDIFEEGLYQRAWSEIRSEDDISAVADLELLSLISNNSRTVANARLLAADLQRKSKNYDEALDTFSASAHDLRLMRRQLLEIQQDNESVLDRLDESRTILTGTILASFDPYDWFPDDPIGRKGLEILTASTRLGQWVDMNNAVVDEMAKALASGYAYDDIGPALDARARLIEVQRDGARLRAQLVQEEQPGKTGTPVDAARAYLNNVPQRDGDYTQKLDNARVHADEQLKNAYRQQQDALAELDNIKAEESALREQARRGGVDAEDVMQARRDIRKRVAQQKQVVDGLQHEVDVWRYRRVRFGVGESQSVVLEASRALDDAAADVLRQRQQEGEADALLQQLRSRIDEKLEDLDNRVAQAWLNTQQQVDREQQDVARQAVAQARSQREDLKTALDAANQEFKAVVENVGDAALRANLGEIDVAWWQKEDVSHYIDSLFRERERQIKRLDSDFWELRD